jgi:hypothetical protein
MAEIAAGRAVVVPVEATGDMKCAAMACWDKTMKAARIAEADVSWFDMMAKVYRAMIAAAPREGEP